MSLEKGPKNTLLLNDRCGQSRFNPAGLKTLAEILTGRKLLFWEMRIGQYQERIPADWPKLANLILIFFIGNLTHLSGRGKTVSKRLLGKDVEAAQILKLSKKETLYLMGHACAIWNEFYRF